MAFGNRGQAALEYLTTYGWAILVIVIVIVALAWLGVFGVQGQVPDRCAFQQGLGCVDLRISHLDNNGLDNKITSLVVRNDMGKTIYFCDLKCTTDLKRGVAPAECTSNGPAIQAGSQARISRSDASLASMGEYCEENFGGAWVHSTRQPGERYVGKILFYYSIAEDAGTGVKARMVDADIVSTVQAG